MSSVPFPMAVDPRRAVKGSRDPLGIQALWTHFGRKLVGNVTTVTTSVRDFTTTLLGYHFLERVRDVGVRAADLPVFLRWEQLAAYARGHINEDWRFRGIERVRKYLGEGRVTISADGAHQILGNQKIYGLWGLFTVP